MRERKIEALSQEGPHKGKTDRQYIYKHQTPDSLRTVSTYRTYEGCSSTLVYRESEISFNETASANSSYGLIIVCTHSEKDKNAFFFH